MKNLWVTGASGFLGWYICCLAQSDWQVYGTYHTSPIQIPHGLTEALDLNDSLALTAYFRRIQPAAVIHTAAQANPNRCQQMPETTYPVNVTASETLASLCAEANIPLIFTSTDLVFDGQQAPYCETDIPHPLSHYGCQKAEAEASILARHPHATVCRLPLLFDLATPTAECFMQSFEAILAAGHPVNLFLDEWRTPVSAMTAARGLLQMLKCGARGYLHLGGQERISRYDLGVLMAEVLGWSTARLSPCLRQDVPMAAPRPADVSLESCRAFRLGYAPESLRSQLLDMAKRRRELAM